MIRKKTLKHLRKAVGHLDSYYQDVRAILEFLEIRFRMAEYGVTLTSLSQNALFSNASGYQLADESDYPFYLWTPSWLGRFYVAPALVPAPHTPGACPIGQAPVLAFVWLWHGEGDAYVDSNQTPECWIGVTAPQSDNAAESTRRVADTIFRHFRYESTRRDEQAGWTVGRFAPNAIGCNLSGDWYLRRISLSQLTSFYQVEKLIIKPLALKYHELASALPLWNPSASAR